MIESQYTAKIHSKLPDHIFHWKIADPFAGGVPDAFYRIKNTDTPKTMWVEYKFIKDLPKRENTLVIPALSPLQVLWLKEAEAGGEIVRIILGVESLKKDRGAAGVILTLEQALQGAPRAYIEKYALSYSEICSKIEAILYRK